MEKIFREARALRASDIHFTYGLPIMLRIDGDLQAYDEAVLDDEAIYEMLSFILTKKELEEYEAGRDIDTAVSIDAFRYRVNAYRQRDHYAIAIRILNESIPSFEELGLPVHLKRLCLKKRGLILVTGPTGSGKSTSLAAMTNYINEEKSCHIITLEDPIEYIHENKRAMINQREIERDVPSFAAGLRSALREDPDVILVGEMRDYETISLALTAAETGHLVFATLHTSGSADTIDRIVDVFPATQQNQIRMQLSGALVAIVSQSLLPMKNKDGRVGCFEVMIKNDAIANLIREKKTYQINSFIQTATREGMTTFDGELMSLYKKGIISHETLIESCHDIAFINKIIQQERLLEQE